MIIESDTLRYLRLKRKMINVILEHGPLTACMVKDHLAKDRSVGRNLGMIMARCTDMFVVVGRIDLYTGMDGRNTVNEYDVNRDNEIVKEEMR